MCAARGLVGGSARARADGDGRRERRRRDLASVDDAAFVSAADAVVLGGQGAHTVRFLSVDAAGNQERIRRRAFVLDWTAPGVSFGVRAPLRVFVGEPVRPRFSVADALSPECRVWMRLDRDGEQVWLRAWAGSPSRRPAARWRRRSRRRAPPVATS